MITEKMLSAINDIDEEMIADAAPGSRYEKISYAQRRRRIYRVASLAACLCIVVAVLAVTGLGRSAAERTGGEKNNVPGQYDISMPDYSSEKVTDTSSVDDRLFKIGNLSPLQTGAAGGEVDFCPKGTVPGEGFMEASDVPAKLAVYHHEGATPLGEPVGLDNDGVAELLSTYSQRIGTGSDVRIEADAGAWVRIVLPEEKLPEDINSILGFGDPIVKETWGYRDTSSGGDGSNRVIEYIKEGSVFLEKGDPLKYASVSEPLSGLVYLHIFDYSLVTEDLGEYPVISPKEALALLKDGKYNAPAKNTFTKFPGEENIAGLRIEYPLSPTYEYIVPYYVFTVMLPDADAGDLWQGIKDADVYAEYYVPAIDARYFESESAIFIQ